MVSSTRGSTANAVVCKSELGHQQLNSDRALQGNLSPKIISGGTGTYDYKSSINLQEYPSNFARLQISKKQHPKSNVITHRKNHTSNTLNRTADGASVGDRSFQFQKN